MLQPSSPSNPMVIGDGASSGIALGHILIVEDEQDLADLFRDWIQRTYGDNATVHVATTLADAEATLATLSDIDIALIDRALPDGDGTDLLSVIRTQFDAITVIVTGTSPGSDLIKLPVADYLLKPIDGESLTKRLSLLKKLDASGALQPYSEARKASLLEHHLDNPEQDPLFRQFANRWSYDRLEIAHFWDQQIVYALYTGGGSEKGVRISIMGMLDSDLEGLIADEEVAPVGELVPSGDEYVWVDADGPVSSSNGSNIITIYEFTCETPEQYITDTADEAEGLPFKELKEILESGFN